MKRLPAWKMWLLPVLFVAPLAAHHFAFRPKTGKEEPRAVVRDDMKEWTLVNLRDHLQTKGLLLRLEAERPGQPLRNFGYLLVPGRQLPQTPLLTGGAHIGRWRGMAHCCKSDDHTRDALLQQEPVYSLRVGPFLFFGDPALLARIRETLAP